MKTTVNNRTPITVGFLLFATLVLWGCAPQAWKSAEHAYQSGDIVSSVRYTAQTLREKPGYEDAINFITRIFPSTYEDYYSRAKRAESINDWDEAFKLYTTIKTLSDIVAGIPKQTDPNTKTLIQFPTKNVESEIQVATNKAAEKHYQNALSLENAGKHKDAAKAFTRALEYISGYKDATERYEKMRTAAVRRVAVMPFENKSGKIQYGEIGESISENIISDAMADPKNLEFMDLISRDRINQLMTEQRLGKTGILDEGTAVEMGKVLGLHAFVFGKVTSIATSNPPETKSRKEERAEIYQGKDKPKRQVYAVVDITTRKAKATVTCSFQVIDVATGKIVKSGTVPSEDEILIQFGRFSGDEDALSSKSRNLCSKADEYPPSPDELVQKAVGKAAKTLSEEIAGYFR
jgi:TolB-like protein